MKVLLLPAVITILFWIIKHNADKSKHPNKTSVQNYLAKEDAANSARKKDISGLPYIQVPAELLYLDITLNDEKKQSRIAEYKKMITEFSEKRMLNLIGVTNTQLKEAYGPVNLEPLTIYDQNYGRYLRTLQLLADCIYEECPAEAVYILEYCISTGTDISGTYDLLGRYYMSQGRTADFEALYDKVPDKTTISGKVIKSKLDRIAEEAASKI